MTTITASLPGNVTQTLDVDAVITEAFHDAAMITDHPVEKGSNVSDHIRPEPERLHFELLVSNTIFKSGQQTFSRGGSVHRDLRAESAYDLLNEWRLAGALLSLTTTMGFRSSLAIETLSLNRDAKTGGVPGHTGGAKINLAVKQVRLVQNKLTTITVSKDVRVPPKTKAGAQPTSNEPSSAAFSIASKASAVFTNSSSADAGPVGQFMQSLAAGAK